MTGDMTITCPKGCGNDLPIESGELKGKKLHIPVDCPVCGKFTIVLTVNKKLLKFLTHQHGDEPEQPQG